LFGALGFRSKAPRMRFVIAIDGPAGSGKSTVAKRVADLLGLRHLDTGAMYRATAWLASREAVTHADGTSVAGALNRALADGRLEFEQHKSVRVAYLGAEVTHEIRTPEIGQLASVVSQHGSVRDVLVSLQRRLAEGGGIVLEGRDIGTVVFPDAELKVYLTADDLVRAERRASELKSAGQVVSLEETLREVRQRDERDRNRAIAPLRQAEDAVVVDSSSITAEQAAQQIANQARTRGMKSIAPPK
jgi:cytidylate kinase